MGWVPLFMVMVNGIQCHIPDDWGLVTLEEVHTEMTAVHGAQTQAHQDLCMVGQCLWVSLLDDARNKVTSHANQYTFDGYKSGPALLRAIIACTHIDTRVSSERVLRDLENLGAIMIKFNSAIPSFNMYMENKHMELCACGMQDTAAIMHFFQGYEVAEDETFVAWIKRHHENVDDGTVVFTTEQLMAMVLCKYQDLFKSGLWARPNADQEKIIALMAKLGKIKKNLKQQPQQPKKDAKKPVAAGSTKSPQPEDKWKFVVLSNGVPKTKTKGDKTYHWCLHHNDGKGMWVIHAPNDCKNKGKAKNKDNKKPAMTTTVVRPAIRFNANTTTIENGSDSN